MFPRVSVEVAGTTMLALLRLLDHMPARYGSSTNAVVDEAILAWIAAQEQRQSRDPAGQGYRWKTVFLPAGTHLEVRTHGETSRAQVVGDEIRHEGKSVSPNGFVAACAGATRNAWREIPLLLPGERYWKPADMLRREVERAQALAAEAETSAAKAGATSWPRCRALVGRAAPRAAAEGGTAQPSRLYGFRRSLSISCRPSAAQAGGRRSALPPSARAWGQRWSSYHFF